MTILDMAKDLKPVWSQLKQKAHFVSMDRKDLAIITPAIKEKGTLRLTIFDNAGPNHHVEGIKSNEINMYCKEYSLIPFIPNKHIVLDKFTEQNSI